MMPPIVTVGLGAKIEGKVSTSALDRISNALADALSPFTEKRGLNGDMIRWQRADLALDMALRARAKVKLLGKEPEPVPTKILVPLLEKATLEEEGSDMVDRWASLLASISVDMGMRHPIYADIMSKISGDDARLLDLYAEQFIQSADRIDKCRIEMLHLFNKVVVSPLSDFINEKELHTVVDKSGNSDDSTAYAKKSVVLIAEFMKECQETGIWLIQVRYNLADFQFYYDFPRAFGDEVNSAKTSLDVLTSVGLLRRSTTQFAMPSFFVGEFECLVEYIQPTSIGLNLIEALHFKFAAGEETDGPRAE